MIEVDSEGVVRASGNLEALARSSKRAEKSTDDMGRAALDTAVGVGILSKAVYDLAGSWVSFAREGLQAYAHFEQMETGLSAMLGSAEKGRAFFEDLRTFSNQTTFGVDTLADASSQLLALGVGVDDVKDRLEQLGNIAGGSTEKFNRLVEVYTKIQATGKANSIWINQLSALTGISWRKILGDMGVEDGKATANDITKAIIGMTAEGGKFHDRMNAIIDTVEGKEGFIRDTGKELSVLWTEVTGKADAYKSALDAVYDVQYGFLGVLKDIAGNEAAKGIAGNVYLGGIIAITTMIATGLVPSLWGAVSALNAVKVAVAAIRAMLSLKTLAVSAAVTGLALIVKYVMNATAGARELKKEFNGISGEIAEAAETYDAAWGDKAQYKFYSGQAERYRAQMDNIDSQLRQAYADYERRMSLIADPNVRREQEAFEKENTLYPLERAKVAAWREYNKAAGSAEYYRGILDDEARAAEEAERLADRIAEAKSTIDKAFADTEEGARATRLAELQKLRETLAGYMNDSALGLSADEMEKTRTALFGVYREIEEITGPKEARTLSETLGLDKAEDKLKSIKEVFDRWVLDRVQSGNIGEMVEGYGADTLVSKSGDAQNAAQGFASGGVWGAVIATVIGGISNAAEGIDAFDEALNPVTTFFEQMRPTLEQVGRILERGVDILKRTGSQVNAVIEPTVEGLADFMDAVHPIAEACNDLFMVFLVPLRVIAKGLGEAFRALGVVIKPVADLFDYLFGWIGDLFGDVEEAQEEEADRIAELNEEYRSLVQTMRDNQEYYLQMKQNLIADDYTRKALSVNDMILTPNGNFSTHPDDTIIAMKNPENLGGSRVIVNNYSGSNVDVQENDYGEIIVNISRQVASDFASGKNGWDSAYARMQVKSAGRRVMA